MQASLAVPTATSFRVVPAKLLEVNRSVINGYRCAPGGKVSFTHLIGYAVVRAIADDVKVMNSTFVEGGDGKPWVVRHEHVNLGLAVDVEKSDGSRTLVVPVLRVRDAMSFAEFVAADQDLIRKVRTNKLTVDDFQGATITLTNPGTIGTVQSVPLAHAGSGRHRRSRGDRLPGRVPSCRRTHPRRARRVEDRHYHLDLRPPHHPRGRVGDVPLTCARAAARRGRLLRRRVHLARRAVRSSEGGAVTSTRWNARKRDCRSRCRLRHSSACNRVRGHLIADLDPLAWKAPRMEPELYPATYGLTIWDLDREFLTGGLGGMEQLELGEILRILRDAYCRTIGIEYMHIQDTAEQRWIQEQVEGVRFTLSCDEQRHLLSRLNAALRHSRSSSPRSTSAKSGSVWSCPSRRSRSSTRSCRRPPTRVSTVSCSACRTAAG